MARGVNKVFLIGNLGQDPELNYTGSGTAVCNFSIATNESYKDSDDNWVERTEWHNIETWGRTAETCDEYLQKGRTVFVEGKLQTDTWEDRDGNTRKTTKIRAYQVQFLDSGGAGPQRGGQKRGGSRGGGRPKQRQPSETQRMGSSSGQNGSDRSQDQETFEPDDDLPF